MEGYNKEVALHVGPDKFEKILIIDWMRKPVNIDDPVLAANSFRSVFETISSMHI